MRVAVVVLALLAGTTVARAQTYPAIQDRDFALDLYSGAALGSIRIVGMGGAANGIAEGSAGVLTNPAAAAVRLTTSKGSWDWDWHLDGLSAVFASDFDNNGVRRSDDFATRMGTVGIAGMYRGWGLSVVGTWQTSLLALSPSGEDSLTARTLTTKVALAKELFDQAWTVGAALRIGTFSLDSVTAGAPSTLFSLSGAGLEAGTLWRPKWKDYRVGAALSLPVSGTDVAASCDPLDCQGYILPERVEVPWSVSAGVAWRRAPTYWNQQVTTDYRDEKALMLAVDVVLTGGVPGGAGLEKFGEQQLQPSGRHLVLSVRGGAEYEIMPARLRLRAGSYWEPSRFTGVSGRLHGTFGAEVSLFEVGWPWRLRGKLALTADIAPRYGNAGLSVGFWH